MGKFVTTDDFIDGQVRISQTNNSKKQLNTVIDIQEVYVLEELMGSELYALFIADLDIDNQPQTQRFIDIFDAFYDDSNVSNYYGCWCGKAYRSEGIPQMLQWFIYWEFAKDQPFQNTAVGTVRNVEENSDIVNGSKYGLPMQYNKGVKSYQAIARFMIDNSSDYPEYNGIAKNEIVAVL